MQNIDQLIAQRVQEALDRQNQQRRGVYDELGAIKGILGAGGQQPVNVFSGMQSPMAAPPSSVAAMGQPEIKPEDYEYLVDIEKRDVYGQQEIDPETGLPKPQKPIGWDKGVRRYARKAKAPDPTDFREPKLGDLSGESMRNFDKRRDKRGRFMSESMEQGTLFEE
jgi:hypothetical protein